MSLIPPFVFLGLGALFLGVGMKATASRRSTLAAIAMALGVLLTPIGSVLLALELAA